MGEIEERYELNWIGKRAAISEASIPTTKRLIPVPEESVDFDSTGNLYIEGDNLDALKLMQEEYAGKVKMIYIDPPYNTGNKFIYNDKRTHSEWLSFMYPRLKLARNLLREDGVIFISIDDHELYNLQKLCDEIFGEGNFVANIIWKKKYIGGKHAKHFVDLHEYILVFAMNIQLLGEMFMERPCDELNKFILEDEYLIDRGKYYIRPLKSNLEFRKTLIYPIKMPDGKFIETQWMVSEATFIDLEKNGRILYKQKKNGEYNVYRKYYEKDGLGLVKVPTLIEGVYNADAKIEIKNIFNIMEGREIPFNNPKPTKLINYFLNPTTKDNDLILDFFSGSATTAHAVMQLNAEDGGKRKFIMVQIPEAIDEKSEAYKAGYRNICEIGKERIRKAGKRIREDSGLFNDLDTGFKVYRISDGIIC